MDSILTLQEAKEWLNLDYDEDNFTFLMQVAYDAVVDSIDNIEEKLKSAKFKRKLKLCVLNTLVNMHDDKGISTDKKEQYKYINQSMMLQLQYGTYLETDT
ncbi:hypothetical protein HYI19_18500 [Clostridium botulinum]|uniref:head-tail connector protein n=1 Tax=Clostridium botulinum TaxID=1491 RepID=UPI001969ECF4|nr:head-tail connector protein [Clostridium botulinum]MBN3369091.1 hypothetical protein [Clostridium botulinum]MBN3376117.1 hypothetical protein [Clostridium botulinum]MBY6846785.1 hypothetical protein [Clostridium botulinum]